MNAMIRIISEKRTGIYTTCIVYEIFVLQGLQIKHCYNILLQSSLLLMMRLMMMMICLYNVLRCK